MALKSYVIFSKHICELFSAFTVTGNQTPWCKSDFSWWIYWKQKTGQKTSSILLINWGFFNKILKASVLLILLASSFSAKPYFQSSCSSTSNGWFLSNQWKDVIIFSHLLKQTYFLMDKVGYGLLFLSKYLNFIIFFFLLVVCINRLGLFSLTFGKEMGL